jgi:5-methylthioadenosine/S-adenosylhomocysteine deaminase
VTLVVRGCDVLAAPGRELRADVDLVVEGARIAAIEPSGAAPHAGATVIDGRRLLAIPGLVNAHTHSPENPLRGVGEGLTLEPWLRVMLDVSGPYDAEDHYVCALAGAVEMLRSGATAVVDHLLMTPPRTEAVDAVMRAYRDVGMRAAVAPMVDDLDFTGDLARACGLPDEGAYSRQRRHLPAAELAAQLDDVMCRWQGAEGRLDVLAGPSGVQWCGDELLLALADVAARHGAGLHLHLLETFVQAVACRTLFGQGAVRRLDVLGVLGRCSLAHAVWLEDDDVAILAERGAVVVHNPAANLRLASGRAPVRALLDGGVTVALGTDGAASSDNQVMWDQLKLAALVHADPWRPGIRALEALTMATAGGAAVLGMGEELSTLEPGRLADVTLLDRSGDGLAGAADLEVALALSETGRGVRHVLVGGELVVRDGRCTRVDEDAARARLREQAERRRTRRPGAATRSAAAQLERLRQAVWSRNVEDAAGARRRG